MAEVAKRRMSKAKAALERELKDIERKKEIQHKRIESAFDQLYRIIEEKKQAIHLHFSNKFSNAEERIRTNYREQNESLEETLGKI